ncbi:MAG: hypothetical protein M1827_004374 [Pycnora praestabilis]|nr:MAG: hypothetical protein M1827_004374 [Pycnora praestabilis]
MPLILVSGYPCAGKTHRSLQLVQFLHEKITANAAMPNPDPRISRLKIHHINVQGLGVTRDVYREARAEKDARAAEYSAIKRALGKDDIVIADGLNYIKGFRYQLYCEAKAAGTPSCVVHVGTPVKTCQETNTSRLNDGETGGGYPIDVFENLLFRYEEPNGMSRWDSPLFTVLYDDPTPPLGDIWDAMVGSEGRIKSVKPNQATVLKPATEFNYLYDLDRTTQEMVTHILDWQTDHPGEQGGRLSMSDTDQAIELPASAISLPQLQRIRRSFITLNRQHLLSKNRIRDQFADYLNNSFSS